MSQTEPHVYTDRRNRNLCDRCDRYLGAKAHLPQRTLRDRLLQALDGFDLIDFRADLHGETRSPVEVVDELVERMA